VRPRKGAVGKQGSIAIVERLIRSLKRECTRRIRIPLGLEVMRREVSLHAMWYNESRPHQSLDGMTPEERYDGGQAHHRAGPVEPRRRWPLDEETRRVKRIHLVVEFLEGRWHLPIVELKRVA